jgi:hypothetical protein
MNHTTISCAEIQQCIHCISTVMIYQITCRFWTLAGSTTLYLSKVRTVYDTMFLYTASFRRKLFFCFSSAFDESSTELQKDKASYFSFPIKTVTSKNIAVCLEGGTGKSFQNSPHTFHHSASHISLPKCHIQANMCPSQK